MKNYYKKTTTKTTEHQKIRKDLCSFTTKHLGGKLPHMRKLKQDTTFNDYTLVSFATGKVNVIQETKVFLVAKHNGNMYTDSTSTHALKLGNTTMYIKTNRNNPLLRTTLPEKNKTQKRYYSNTQKKDTKPEEKVEQAQTWYEYYISPYFTHEYNYIGQVTVGLTIGVTTAAIVYWYVTPMVVNYLYGSATNNNHRSSTAQEVTRQIITNNTSDLNENSLTYRLIQTNKNEIQNEINDKIYILNKNSTLIEKTVDKLKQFDENTIYDLRMKGIEEYATKIKQYDSTITRVEEKMIKNTILEVKDTFKEEIEKFKTWSVDEIKELKRIIESGKLDKEIKDYISTQQNITDEVKNKIIECFVEKKKNTKTQYFDMDMTKDLDAPEVLRDIVTLQRDYGIKINEETMRPIIEALKILKENEILPVELEIVVAILITYYDY